MAPCCRESRRRGAAALQLAEVLRAALPSHAAAHALPAHHWKTLHALLRCHTAELGGHLYRCADCGREHFIAHSCRNRHCPSCQRAGAEDWLARQSESLLPVAYFHLVFTLPHCLNGLIRQNQRQLYKLLFDSASATLLQFGRSRLQGADRRHRGAAHLEPDAARSLPSSLHRHRRRAATQRCWLEKQSPALPVSGSSNLKDVPWQVSRWFIQASGAKPAQLPRFAGATERSQ